MNSKEIAAQLKILRQQEQDDNIWLLKAFAILQTVEIKQVLQYYQDINAGKLLVAEIKASLALSAEQKQIIEKNIKQHYPNQELVFIYELDPKLLKGLEIRVADNEFEFTTTKDIQI